MRMLFIHRSVGRLLVDRIRSTGGVEGVALWDYDANVDELRNSDGAVVPCSFHITDGDTNPEGLARFFTQSTHDPHACAELLGFDILSFKSCYSASRIKSESQLSEYMKSYGSIFSALDAAKFSGHLLLVTPPPRRPVMTSHREASLAGAFSKWLMDRADESVMSSGFDLHSLLSNSSGVLRREYRPWVPYDQHPNSSGVTTAASELVKAIALISGEPGRRN